MSTSQSRTDKSIKNTILAVSEQCIYSIMSFLSRTVFVYTLGKTYLGFSGLFSDILTLLSLAELGIGTAITYSMYKPAADCDYKNLAVLLNTYKRIYNTIGIIITIIGVCLTPFLNIFISGIPDIKELPYIYLLYLLNTTASYFFIYKKSILIVEQKNYISSIIYSICIVSQNLLQIFFLIQTRNFIVYLIIQVLCTLANNILISIYVDKHYDFIKKYKDEKISQIQKDVIISNVKAMVISKLSSAIVSSTDSLLISSFVSTIVLGLYSNYAMFLTMIRTMLQKVFEALTGSVGNLVSTESGEKSYQVFKRIWFLNFWMVSFFTICLWSLVDPFISLWIGDSYLLSKEVVFIICLNMYMRLIRNTFLVFIDTYGLFTQIKKKCIAEAFINLGISLIFVGPLKMGILGVLLGTFVSNITTNFWYEPYILYYKKFNKSLILYFTRFGLYALITGILGLLERYFIDYIIGFDGWFGFVCQFLFVILTVNIIIVLIFFKTEEFKYVINIINSKFIKKGR